MSITVLQSAATLTGLQPQGGPARPITQPPCAFSGIDVDLAGAAPHQTGIWECTPGKFERVLPNAEVMHILTGACIFTLGGDGAVHQLPRRCGMIMGHDLAGDISQRADGLIRD